MGGKKKKHTQMVGLWHNFLLHLIIPSSLAACIDIFERTEHVNTIDQ